MRSEDSSDIQRSALLGVDRVLGRIENVFNDIGGLFIFALMWLTMAEVPGRQLFNSPVPGAIDHIEVGMPPLPSWVPHTVSAKVATSVWTCLSPTLGIACFGA